MKLYVAEVENFSSICIVCLKGTLYPKSSSKTRTFISTLRALWLHILNSRRKFEETPDRGKLGLFQKNYMGGGGPLIFTPQL